MGITEALLHRLQAPIAWDRTVVGQDGAIVLDPFQHLQAALMPEGHYHADEAPQHGEGGEQALQAIAAVRCDEAGVELPHRRPFSIAC